MKSGLGVLVVLGLLSAAPAHATRVSPHGHDGPDGGGFNFNTNVPDLPSFDFFSGPKDKHQDGPPSGTTALFFSSGPSNDSKTWNSYDYSGSDLHGGDCDPTVTPLPGSLPLFASAVALFGILLWQRARRLVPAG